MLLHDTKQYLLTFQPSKQAQVTLGNHHVPPSSVSRESVSCEGNHQGKLEEVYETAQEGLRLSTLRATRLKPFDLIAE